MKHKIITFFYNDINFGTINTVETVTTRRTVDEAWEDIERVLHEVKGMEEPNPFNQRFSYTHAVKGKIVHYDPAVPLRRPTSQEAKELAKGT